MTEPDKILCLCTHDLNLRSKYEAVRSLPATFKRFEYPSQEPRFFIFYGHGTDTEMIGQNRKPIIDLENAHLLKGWLVYAMACSTSKALGPAVIAAGGVTYIGFNRHFQFIPSTHLVFKECVNNIVKEILNGRNIGEAVELTKDKFDYYINEYREKSNQTDNPVLKRICEKTFTLLEHDKNSLTLLGKKEISL